MPANTGSQIVSLIHYMAATSPNVNRRHQDVRLTGIYTGGRLSVVDGPTKAASLSVLVCEISDGTYQVKVQTTVAVSLTAVLISPYFVLRWTYTGAASDFMEILAVDAPLANDIVLGKSIFTEGGDLQGFDYGDTSYPRSTPNTQDLFLKVEPTEISELHVRVRAGQIHASTGIKTVSDQKSTVFTAPTADSKVYLLYVDTDGTIAINSSGTEAASPEAPSYDGKIVLAEITLASTDTNIAATNIKDVRNFIAAGPKIERYLATYNSTTQQIANGAFTKADLGTIKNQSGITITNNRITLTAGRKYALSYAVSGQPTADSTYDPLIEARWQEISGDLSWDLEVISVSKAECAEANRVSTNISNTCYIIPSSDTVIELQVYTQNDSQKSVISLVTTNIMAID